MSDFLTSLLARSEGSAEFVRPRTPSMFEPAKPASAANASGESEEMSDSGLEDSDLERDQEIESMPPQDLRRPNASPIRSRSQARVARSAINQAREDSDAMSALPVVSARFQNDSAVHEADAGNPTQYGEMRTLRARAGRHSVESPESGKTQSPTIDPVETSDPAEHAVSRDIVRARIQSKRVDIAASARSSNPSSLSAPSPNAANAMSARLPDQSITPAAVRNAVEYSIGRDYSGAHNSASLGRGTSAEPIVQVSIGRIEIHAIAGEAPTPRKDRAASPVLSLDEYLRSRAKGAAR
jgi:hypothetical protein